MIFGKHINKYYVKYSLVILFGILALVSVDYFQLKIPEFYRIVVNGINDGEVLIDGSLIAFSLDVLWQEVCLPMFFVIVILIVGRFLWRICFFGSGIKVEKDLRAKMFEHCKDLSCQFYSNNKIGNLMSLFTNDLETVQDCFGGGMMMTCDALFLGSLSLIKMFKMNWVLTLFALIPMGLMFAVGVIVGKSLTHKWELRQQAFSNLSDFAQESFSGVAVIKAFVKELKELLAFKRLNKDNENANVQYTKASVLLNILVTLFVESVICIILGYGGYLVYTKVFNAGQLMEFIGYFNAIVWPIMAITELIEMSSRGKVSLKRVSELLSTKQDVKDNDNAVAVSGVEGKIQFKNLTFRYPGADYDALNDVSFVINKGESVGIVGKTGSGKTTIADLILRCYNVPNGTLFVDDMDVNDVTIRSLRQYCAYVPQDNFLFSDTVSNNIAFASETVDDDLVVQTGKLAVIDDNVKRFHAGYQTVLGERGVTVSGGQKQRISIARALYKDASILIMDDSVSAVDTDTEKTILNNLRAIRNGKTTILIAHRITTVQTLDKIVYVDNGKVVDVGTHEQLLSRCKPYQNMVALQALEDESKEEN